MKKKIIIPVVCVALILIALICLFFVRRKPDDLLDLEFRSKNTLVFNGEKFYLLNDMLNYCGMSADYDELVRYGSAKITKEVWTTGSNCRLNGYDSVYVGYSPSGKINVIRTNNSVWIDKEYPDTFKDAVITKVIIDSNPGSGGAIETLRYNGEAFDKIADVNDCIPISSLNDYRKRIGKIYVYSADYPALYYSFYKFTDNGKYYLGVLNPKGQFSYMIRITDEHLINELNK